MSQSAASAALVNDEALVRKPFLTYFQMHPRSFFLGLATLFVTNLLDALPPLLIGRAIDQIAQGQALVEIAKTVGILVVLSTCLAFTRYLWRIYWNYFHHAVAEDLRGRIFRKFMELSANFFKTNPVGQLMSLINSDVNSFRMAIGPGVLVLFDAAFILLFIPPLMYSLSPSWTWKTLVLMPLIPFFIARIIRAIHRNYRLQQDRFSEMSGAAQEIVAGIRVIKSYAQEENQTRIFNTFSRPFEGACNSVARLDGFFMPVLQMGAGSGAVILLLVGAPEVIAGEISIGSFFAFYQYIQRMTWPMSAIGTGLSMNQQGRASFRRIVELLLRPAEIQDRGRLEPDEFQSLEVRGLTYRHPEKEEPSLKDVSFTLRAGEILGVVGLTGAGKSTLIDILNRVYPAPAGTVLVNGVPIEDIRLDRLRSLIATVPQEAFLFSDTVASNLALGSEVDGEELRRYARLVNIDSEIDSLPDGYHSYLGERGVNLSGGQKQRLTIARALLRKSSLLILDDSLSAVDAKTEENILHQLRSHVTGGGRARQQTVMVISHRLASLKWADRILVLNQGRVEACGDSDSLLKASPTYRHLHELQYNRGEHGL